MADDMLPQQPLSAALLATNPDMMVRTIGRVDIPLLEKFLNEIADLTEKAKGVRVTTAVKQNSKAGTAGNGFGHEGRL